MITILAFSKSASLFGSEVTHAMSVTFDDAYRFLVRMHQSEHAARIDFERFMAGEGAAE